LIKRRLEATPRSAGRTEGGAKMTGEEQEKEKKDRGTKDLEKKLKLQAKLSWDLLRRRRRKKPCACRRIQDLLNRQDRTEASGKLPRWPREDLKSLAGRRKKFLVHKESHRLGGVRPALAWGASPHRFP
jgi:hypothetical protein